MVIGDSELDDFKCILNNNNYSVGDFKIKDRQTSSPDNPNDIYPVQGVVTVSCVSTGKTKTYNCGHGENWLESFESDLNNNTFS